MHTFLMILLWISLVPLVLIALILLLLAVPVIVSLEYKEGKFYAGLKLLGLIQLPVFPIPEKPEKEKKPKKQRKPKPAPKPASKPESEPQAAPAKKLPAPRQTAEHCAQPAEKTVKPEVKPAAPAEKTEPPAKTEQSKQTPPERKTQDSIKKTVTPELIGGILSAAGPLMRRIFRALHITQIILILPVKADDAAQTALQCARVQALAHGITAVLRNFMKLHFRCVHILPDFTGEIKAGPYFSCNIGASPIIIIIAAVYAFVQLRREHVL